MIGDHHGPSAGRATLLVRTVDAILGTHRLAVEHRGELVDHGVLRCSRFRDNPAG
jgi:hypothetical protein